MVSPDLQTPHLQQWSINTQWEFRPNWLLEVGLHRHEGQQPPAVHQPEPGARHRRDRRLPAASGVPGGGFTGNYYDRRQRPLRQPEDAAPRLRSRSTIPASASSRRNCAGRCSGSTKTRARTRSIRTASRGITRCRRACRSASRRATCSTSTTPSRGRSTTSRTRDSSRSQHDQSQARVEQGVCRISTASTV